MYVSIDNVIRHAWYAKDRWTTTTTTAHRAATRKAITPIPAPIAPTLSVNGNHLGWLGGNPELRVSSVVEDDELALEEDIAIDGESDTCIALETTVAGRATVFNGSVVEVGAGNDGAIGADA